MNREQQFKDILIADNILMGILTGGIYTYEEVGIEDLRRDEGSPTENAFDEDGLIKPCAVIRQSSLAPHGQWRAPRDKITPVVQPVFIFFYEFRGHAEIDLAADRVYSLLEGTRLPGSYELQWSFDTEPMPDMGPVKNTTVKRQEWQITSLRRP